MREREHHEKKGLREIMDNMAVEFSRLERTLQGTETALEQTRNDFSARLSAIDVQMGGLARGVIAGEVQHKETYINNLIHLIRELLDNVEFWEILPEYVRTYLGDHSDRELARTHIQDWSDSSSVGYAYEFTDTQTGELLFSEEVIQSMIAKEKRFILMETRGEPKSEVRKRLKKLIDELEQYYLASDGTSFNRELQ